VNPSVRDALGLDTTGATPTLSASLSRPAGLRRSHFAPTISDMATGLDPLGLEDEDAALFPDDQRRLVTFIFRLPIRLPVPHNHFWTLEMGGSLGASWDEEALHVAVPGHVYVQNMQVPFV
jgi:hypothetical protein